MNTVVFVNANHKKTLWLRRRMPLSVKFETERPPWLRGTPTAQLSDGTLLEGIAQIMEAQEQGLLGGGGGGRNRGGHDALVRQSRHQPSTADLFFQNVSDVTEPIKDR